MSAGSTSGVPGDIVGVWKVHLPDGIHDIELEHGTATGKRIIRVDGKEAVRRNWMFSLVGKESFKVGDKPATITIESEGLSFIYSLGVNGQTLKQFVESQNKQMRTWLPVIRGEPHRIILDTKTMDVYVDGTLVETTGEFVEDGAESHFDIGSTSACIKSYSSGKRSKGVLYKLICNNEELDPVLEVKAT